MTRKPQQQDTSSTPRDRDRRQTPSGEPALDNPNERLEQWEERYFEGSPKGGRDDAEPAP